MSIATQIFELYIRKRVTKDIQYSESAALLMVFITVAVHTVAISLQPLFKWPLFTAIGAVALDLSIMYALLSYYQKKARYIQMITAMMGISIISNLLIIITGAGPELASLRFLIQIWYIYLSISILRDVLECSFLKSLFITLGISFLALVILVTLFADPEVLQQIEQASRAAEQGTQPAL